MRRWTEGDEAAFVKRLESELLKCERFQVGKVSALSPGPFPGSTCVRGCAMLISLS